MQKIHFYKKNKIVYSVWANSVEEVELEPSSYYPNYTNDMIISLVEYVNPVIDSKGDLREKTRDELVAEGVQIQLELGEKIENKKLIKIAQPSRWHTWNGTEWVVDLNEVKKAKREELKNIRDNKVRENITLYGAEFQIRNNTDIENFKDVDRALDKKIKKPSDKRNWILADNSIREFTYEQLSKILDEKALRKEKLYDKFGALSIQLENSNSVDEIEAIKWE